MSQQGGALQGGQGVATGKGGGQLRAKGCWGPEAGQGCGRDGLAGAVQLLQQTAAVGVGGSHGSPPPTAASPAGYVRLVNFSGHAAHEMQRAIWQLKVGAAAGALVCWSGPRQHFLASCDSLLPCPPAPRTRQPVLPPPLAVPLKSTLTAKLFCLCSVMACFLPSTCAVTCDLTQSDK